MTEPKPRRTAGLHRDRTPSRPGARAATLAERARGPWRVVVSESSMAPTIEPGDWLLVDPTIARWPRSGSIVVFREPDSDLLAIKRVAGRPGDRVQLDAGHLILGDDEAWLLSDAPDADLLAVGAGQPIDSRRYGPVPVEALVGRVWFRYGPLRRVGVPGRPSPLRR
ncbi:MAG TPA: signal peptidase I [Candidatus Acidoferrum sp.]|nr:signal peptidase I [Candidatus Acidoferrum sp.]